MANRRMWRVFIWIFLVGFLAAPSAVQAQRLDARQILSQYAWLDNRDYLWYASSIPLLDTPDDELNQTYYYRWELITKHVVYGAPEHGYAFTEFLDRPFWSGTYGAISCPAGHQLYELRWLRDPQWAEDYISYWLHVPGAEPRRYSCWLADASWAVHQVHPNPTRIANEYQPMCENFAGWRQRHWDAERGLFWQTGHDDGMEWNINSRQTRDEIRGAPGFRPTLNAYLWADARALARMAQVARQPNAAAEWGFFADRLKRTMQEALWDPKREFFFHQARDDEELDGHVVRAGSLTYQSGRWAGSPHGRELIGYVPWQFAMPDPGYEAAWKFLMDPQFFAAPFGPTTVERGDPLFKVQTRCCMWSGMSWPYATSQTLQALANVLHRYKQSYVTREDYFQLLKTYALSHRKQGLPYLAEACHPFTGSWEGHDSFNHSEHYFHSSFVNLVVTGLLGLQPQDDDRLVIEPLVPADWEYFRIQDVPYKGHRITLFWDRTGHRYQQGPGFQLWLDDQPLASLDQVGRLEVAIEARVEPRPTPDRLLRNFAVNNSGGKWPRGIASIDPDATPVEAALDGQYWYLESPGNRWTNTGSQESTDWIGIDFGIERCIEEVVAYFLDDGPTGSVRPPTSYALEFWRDGDWHTAEILEAKPPMVVGRAANRLKLSPVATTRMRLTVPRDPEHTTTWGVSEFEAWGRSSLPIPHPPRAANLALNDGGLEFPRVSASFTSRFDRVSELNDGIVRQRPGGGRNRWTSYESPHRADWVQVDFSQPTEFGRLELYFYDDGGGVRLPRSMVVEVQEEAGGPWKRVEIENVPVFRPRGTTTVQFGPVTAQSVRIEFEHSADGKTGLSEWEIYRD